MPVFMDHALCHAFSGSHPIDAMEHSVRTIFTLTAVLFSTATGFAQEAGHPVLDPQPHTYAVQSTYGVQSAYGERNSVAVRSSFKGQSSYGEQSNYGVEKTASIAQSLGVTDPARPTAYSVGLRGH